MQTEQREIKSLVDLSRLLRLMPSGLAREAHIEDSRAGQYHRVAGVEQSPGMKAGPFRIPMIRIGKPRLLASGQKSPLQGVGAGGRRQHPMERRGWDGWAASRDRATEYQHPNQGSVQATSGQRLMLCSDKGHRSGGTEICSTQAAGACGSVLVDMPMGQLEAGLTG